MNSNLKSHINIFKQEGTSRYERGLWALNPENVALDDRRLQDFIAYAQRYSENVLFVDTDAIEGDTGITSWEFFFKHDVVLLIANIATKNIGVIKESYEKLAKQFQQEKSLGNFIELVEYVFSRFQKLNSWYYSSNQASALKKDLTLYIRSYLIDDLENLQIIKSYLATLRKINYSIDDFKMDLFNRNDIDEIGELLKQYNKGHRRRSDGLDSDKEKDDRSNEMRVRILHKISNLLQADNVWEIKERKTLLPGEQIFLGDDEVEKLTNAALSVDSIFEAVFHVIQSINNSCNSYFEDTINGKQDHAPHIALLIAFFKLYAYLQSDLNRIPQRHLDYYYRDILKIKEKHAIPDQVFVVFDLAQGFESGEIKAGTEILAGKDKTGVDRIYKLDDDFVINRASVSSLNTIFIQKIRDQILNYYTSSPSKSPETAGDAAFVNSRRLFGEVQKKDLAEIGFAIASNQFYLEKGERNVTVTFELAEDIQIIRFNTGIIKILLTGQKGWLSSDVVDDRIKINSFEKTGDKKITLNFSISVAQESAIIAFDQEIHSGEFKTVSPILQCILKYPASEPEDIPSPELTENLEQLKVLQHLQMLQLKIIVQVGSLKPQVTFDGVRDLILDNHEAPLDGKKPFYPFTPTPKVGSSFYIGCKDLFYKDINSLSINIEWMLPENFGEYYQKYLPPYDSNKFIATLSILKKHVWKKIEDLSIIDIDTREPKFRSIRLDFDKMKGEKSVVESTVPSFDNTHKNCTLRLKLLYPDFGHSIYPQLITSAVMEKASSKSSSVDYYKLVKKELHDSTFSIKLPENLNDRSGPLRVVVYDVLEHMADDMQARIAMVKGLSRKIKEKNGSNIVIGRTPPGSANTPPAEGESRVEVNDDNIVERVFSLLKRIRLIPRDAHFDQDRQSTSDVVNEVKDRINTFADFIMPSDRELEQIIFNETNNAIDKTTGNVVEELLKWRKSEGMPDTNRVAELIKKEIGEANEVINDMIARKIATLLSARELPPPPYTPLINNISINYSSAGSSSENRYQFFHLTPLGVIETALLAVEKDQNNLNADKSKSIVQIFPSGILENRIGETELQGMLFIGVSNLLVNQNLSLLIQLSEGSRINDKKPPEIFWWYLVNKDWIKLDQDYLVSDGTTGLQTTGIITFSIPSNATNVIKLFGSDSLFWLCASVVENADAFPRFVDIKAQASVATFKDHENDPGHLDFSLEADQVKGLIEKLPFVKKVSQPVPSINGKPRERQQEYYVRVSERLRHKSRAINNWDYEHLVLDNFPFLYKVKCLNNYYSGGFLIGHITIVPIIDLTNKSYVGNNRLIPKTNYIDLRRIEKFLIQRASPFVKIHAVNPQIDQVLISCKVKFRSKRDKGYYLTKLNADLVTFLTPWTSGDMETLSFSSKIYASSIINFIDKRDYVDYVTDFEMRQFTENESGEKVFYSSTDQLEALDETVFTTAHSILISAEAHDILILDERL